jgi:hypothetical protein
VELTITQPLDDFDLTEVEAPIPRYRSDSRLARVQRPARREARAILEREFMGSNLEIAQLTGAICKDGAVYHPGICLVVRETGDTSKEMSAARRVRASPQWPKLWALCSTFLELFRVPEILQIEDTIMPSSITKMERP